jgi:tRNA:m4X modification enzyme
VERIALALCCHHRCDWGVFVNKPLFLAHGIGRSEFRVLCRLATKYRSHPARNKKKKKKRKRDHIGKEIAPPTRRPSWSPAARLAALRAEVGILFKRTANEARLRWLRSHAGWSGARLVEYVDEKTTPESTLLVARLGTS